MIDNKKKIAFLDRDGVINKNAAEHQYITNLRYFKFNNDIFDLLKYVADRDFEIIVITNQRGIAKKIFSEIELSKIHNHMVAEFNRNDIKILDVFYCPHEKGICNCRKPKPGLIYQAMEKYPIDINNSILITDSENEIEMGKNIGLKCSYLAPMDNPGKLLNNLKTNQTKL